VPTYERTVLAAQRPKKTWNGREDLKANEKMSSRKETTKMDGYFAFLSRACSQFRVPPMPDTNYSIVPCLKQNPSFRVRLSLFPGNKKGRGINHAFQVASTWVVGVNGGKTTLLNIHSSFLLGFYTPTQSLTPPIRLRAHTNGRAGDGTTSTSRTTTPRKVATGRSCVRIGSAG